MTTSLYNRHEPRENCGFGLIANIDGVPSHKVVRNAILGLSRMQHRGAILSDGKTGDGCGLSLQLPVGFFRTLASEQNFTLANNFAVGQIFLPNNEKLSKAYIDIINEELTAETLSIAHWRDVPVNPSVLGEIALAEMPKICQVFINAPTGWSVRDLQRRLFVTRRRIEKRIDDRDFYICSFSNQTIIYKGLCMPKDLAKFYPDLGDLRMQSAIVLFHQRFSTNTQPRWRLAQPFRYLAHNGEINTISGNRAWAKARAYKYRTPLIADLQTAAPFVNETDSDSSSLDNMLEVFVCGGMDLFRAMRLLVPPAWQKNPMMDDDLRAFYDFNSMHMEPWDGPAGIVLSDGRYAACNLDRNGLRPARYVITQDRLITIASEVGIWDYAPDEVVEKGRVGPGQLLVIDTKLGKILHSDAIDHELKSRHPYREWLTKNVKKLTAFEHMDDDHIGAPSMDETTLYSHQKQFLYDQEELESILRVMGEDGQEAIGSMGDDTPFAVLSERPRVLFDYFRQYFAQVTNPPIDPLREAHVMSLTTSIGREMSVFFEAEGMSSRVNFDSPILVHSDMMQILALPDEHYKHVILDATFNPSEERLEQALNRLAHEAHHAITDGTVLIIISDKNTSKTRLPIPSTMAVGILQTYLVAHNLRCDANIIVESGEPRNPHHFAVLIGLGATAIYPYLAYESLAHMVNIGAINKDIRTVHANFRNSINKGLYKIMSKMGISCVSSYRCARLFEIVGLNDKVVKTCFDGMVSRIGGADFDDVEAQLIQVNKQAWRASVPVDAGGLLKFKPNAEYHAYNPDVVNTLQKAVNSGDYEDYKAYRQVVNERPVTTLRDLLALKEQSPIDIAQVEPAENLYQRFDSAAISIGALSPEAHESLAQAMNGLGGYSNSGEGGEDPARYHTDKVSRIKQVASGRFGVTPAYLMSADVIQIKVAQGAKPGEGGQLPGDKVSPYIAQLRYAVPGSTLISPPPHHDIYSIEDLAQLIFDLKQINPTALISVKLVSLAGVGTIATGVAKAYADLITIAGYDGGTGASPISSVKYAGSPWELGLAEAHQALVENNLRHKVRLQVDGGLKTGLDVVKAALLGAESFGFGTGPMVALGCRYLRICHLNNCATGVATQDATLRDKHYHGDKDKVMNYFKFIAQDVREIMASLGVTQFTDLVGRTDLLQIIEGKSVKQQKLALQALLYAPNVPQGSARFCTQTNQPFDKGELNAQILAYANSQTSMDDVEQSVSMTFDTKNTDRSIGASLSGMVAKAHGNRGGKTEYNIMLDGTAGQSFGVWLAGGINLTLTGDANDYVGKGMSGGRIVIKPHQGVNFLPHNAVIAGNTCLYGATGGELFLSGQAGERFAVRNSGATAVVEGIGDNGCEYMTGGVVVVLGKCGINFGAGMTGGYAYVLDEHDDFDKHLNGDMVEVLSLSDLPTHQEHLRGLVSRHVAYTMSLMGQEILANWDRARTRFKLIKPKTVNVHALLGHKQRTVVQLREITA